MFNALILTPDRILFEGEARSVFLPGASGEFEILEFHKPIISLLKEGAILVDLDREIPIRAGVARMLGDRLVVIVEE